jgi:hypothetical protein
MYLEKTIVLTEFPKSGGSWIGSMLGDLLEVPRRDIYMTEKFDLFDIYKHPWYSDAKDLTIPRQAIVKSHELPNSDLINFDATYIHLIRDGRDVVVSKWFYEKDFYVKNEITSSFDKEFDDYVIEIASKWANYVEQWSAQSILTARYEDFLTDPVQSLKRLLYSMTKKNYTEERISESISRFSKENFKASLSTLFKHNTFVRKGISGDWKNYFSRKNIDSFKAAAGHTLVTLNYEQNMDWNI